MILSFRPQGRRAAESIGVTSVLARVLAVDFAFSRAVDDRQIRTTSRTGSRTTHHGLELRTAQDQPRLRISPS
jgi:hypothetical protein